MIPNIFIVGKFNVGKSLFFNNINKFNNNLSFKFKSLTLNLKKTFNIYKNFNYIICDTSGFNFFNNFKLKLKTTIYYSDIIFFFINKDVGIFYEDKFIINLLKLVKKYIYLIINKVDIRFININTFFFYKFINNKPYIINCSNNFNNLNIINLVLNNYCVYKNCYHFNNKKNNLKVFLIFYSKNQLKNFINNLLLKKCIEMVCRDISNFNFTISKLFIKLYHSFIFNFNNKRNIKKIIFTNFLKTIVLSKIIFIFVDPFVIFNYYLIIKIIKLNLKFVIFIINFMSELTLKNKIYFLNFFKKKYNLFQFYLFFISIFKKLGFFYFFNYFFKYLKTIKKKNNFKKILLNMNNFLTFQKKNLKFKITHIQQKGVDPILIIIHGKNLKTLKGCIFKLLKINFIFFYKLKSFTIKFLKKN